MSDAARLSLIAASAFALVMTMLVLGFAFEDIGHLLAGGLG